MTSLNRSDIERERNEEMCRECPGAPARDTEIERAQNTVQQARLAMVGGYNDVAPDATHGDGLDSALDAALGVIRARIIDRRIEARSAGQHAVVDALTDLLAELD